MASLELALLLKKDCLPNPAIAARITALITQEGADENEPQPCLENLSPFQYVNANPKILRNPRPASLVLKEAAAAVVANPPPSVQDKLIIVCTKGMAGPESKWKDRLRADLAELIDQGADLERKGKDGKTPLELAEATRNNKKCYTYLKELVDQYKNGASTKTKDEEKEKRHHQALQNLNEPQTKKIKSTLAPVPAMTAQPSQRGGFNANEYIASNIKTVADAREALSQVRGE